jgi:hypothetical protein
LTFAGLLLKIAIGLCALLRKRPSVSETDEKEGLVNRLRKEVPVILAIAALLIAISPTVSHGQTAAPAATPAPADVPVLVAKISSNLNTKNAKVGDVLTAKTLKPWKLADGTELPKGSKLVAKVTSVQSKKAGDGDSMLTFRFDEIDVKGGATVPIHGMVVAIGPGLGPKDSIGANSVMGRGGVGSTPGLDPSAGLGKAGARDEDDIPLGSTLDGVALGRHMDADWTTALKGIHTDVGLGSDVLIKVELRQ